MLKYQEILQKLSTEQKLQLIADFNALGDLPLSEYGFKFIKSVSAFEHSVSKDFPKPESLINSFSEELFRKVSDDITNNVKKDGVTLLGLPCTDVKGSPYSKGYTEDPTLATSFVVQFATTSERAGIETYLQQPYLREQSVAVSDVEYNKRAVREFFLKPVYELLKKGVNKALPKDIPYTANYSEANEALDAEIKEKCTIIKDKVSQEETMAYACSGEILVKNGSLTVLKEAYEKYKTFWSAFEAGEISLSDVETACRSGNALSPQMIDEAAEKILDFSCACATACKKNANATSEKRLGLRATEESIVMLKNNSVLPIRRKKIALIGSLAELSEEGNETLRQRLEKQNGKILRYQGYQKGYDGKKLIDKKLIDNAVMLAKKADVVIVALGEDYNTAKQSRRNHNSNLPANQTALLEALYKTEKKIVGVVYGTCPDMSFDKYCTGILLAPSTGKYSAEAIYDVLCGIVSPSGKLANTCYENTDEYMETLRKYKNAGRNQVGTFYGYRHYDTAGIKIKYPFGFGLSYSKFSYYGLRINDSRISFYVKNTGRFASSEVAQVYVGKKDSGIIRPNKELKVFRKVFLKPGRSTKIIIDRSELDLAVYDIQTNTMVREGGNYEVYVGSSVSDIKLKGKITFNGPKLNSDGKKLSDYFQNFSNIRDGEYYLDVPMKVPKESAEKRRKFTYVMAAIMVCLSIIYLYLNYVGWTPNVLAIHLGVAGATFLPLLFSVILTKRKRNFINKHMEVSRNMKKENREKLDIDQLYDEVPYEQLFEEEFKEEEVIFSEDDEQEEIIEENQVKVETFDKELTLNVICSQLVTFMTERGLILDPVSARSLVSAFASSRLIVLNCDEKHLFDNFIKLFGDYLGSEIVVDDFEGIKSSGGDVLTFRNSYDDTVYMTNVASSLTENVVDGEKIRVMSINNVSSNYLKSYITQIYKYIDSPEKEAQFYVRTDNVDKHYDMPENVWFVVTMAEGEKVTDIPKYILDTLCVVDLIIREPKEALTKKRAKKVKEEVVAETDNEQPQVVEEEQKVEENCEVKVEEQNAEEHAEEVVDDKTPVKNLTFYQFTKLVSNAIRDCQLEENLWKRVDKLEDYVCLKQPYRIDNKHWHRIEKYVSCYLATCGIAEEALDSVVAQHIIYGMLPIIANSKEKNDDKFTHVIENIFGEGHAPYSIKVVKSTGLNV